MQNLYSSFFIQYCRFASKDLIATFDKRFGRNTRVINTFFKVFFIINKKDVSYKRKEEALEQLAKVVDSYLSDGDVPTYEAMYISLNCNSKDYLKSLQSMQSMQTALENFYISVADFNIINKNKLFKQGLIEFNNALAHLFKGFCTSETNLELNISKACTHLHRGSLDYYKTLIKNKESLTPKQKETLIKIRVYEIDSIGLNVVNVDKDTLLIKYRNFVRELYNLENN